jgi:hypothetical protein
VISGTTVSWDLVLLDVFAVPASCVELGRAGRSAAGIDLRMLTYRRRAEHSPSAEQTIRLFTPDRCGVGPTR